MSELSTGAGAKDEAASDVQRSAADKRLIKQRAWSYETALVVNSILAGVNIANVITNMLTHNYYLVALCSAVAAGLLLLAWQVSLREQQARIKLSTMESYRDEQLADTEMKRMMIKAMRKSGDVGAFMRIGMTEPTH